MPKDVNDLIAKIVILDAWLFISSEERVFTRLLPHRVGLTAVQVQLCSRHGPPTACSAPGTDLEAVGLHAAACVADSLWQAGFPTALGPAGIQPCAAGASG